jgi:nucleotide-binding universal stress UspA family protein
MDAHSHIVVGFDGSTTSELALHHAVTTNAGSPYGMVHVACFVEKTADGVRLPTGEKMSRWAAGDYLRHVVTQLAKGWAHGGAEVRIAIHIKGGNPDESNVARELVDLAYRLHADQIAIGVRGHGLDRGGRIGRTAQAILDHSDIPVHVESGLRRLPEHRPNLLRWAYVFGGNALRRERLNSVDLQDSSDA